MAFSASNLSGVLARAFSWGPFKIELQSFSAVSTDTSGTVNSAYLHSIGACVLMGSGTLCQTSAPSISGTAATLAFADPASACAGYSAKNVNGYVILIGA